MTHTITLTEGQYEGMYEKVEGEPRIGDLIRFSQREDAVYYVRSLNTEEDGDDENLIIVSCDEGLSEMIGGTAFAFYPFEQDEVFRKVVEYRTGMFIEVIDAQPAYSDYEEGKEYKNGDIFEVGFVWPYGDGLTTTQNVDLWLSEVRPYEKSLAFVTEEDGSLAISGELTQSAGSYCVQEDEFERLREEILGRESAVDHPSHYTQGKFETIEVIEEITQGYDDGYIAYCVGNTIKYLARAPHKHDTPLEDLKKAAKYLEFAISRLT